MLTTAIDQQGFDPRFGALSDEGRAHLEAERLEEALRAFEGAEALAEELEDRRAADRAYVNRCAVLIAIDRGLDAGSLQRLREILMAGDDAVSCRLAAYNIARSFEFGRDYRKGLFYARIALDRSETLGVVEWLASSHNQIGNFLLAESQFHEACAEYEEALENLAEEDETVRKAAIYDNLGYAYVIIGRVREGLTLLYRSLRRLRELGRPRETILPHLSLCYALIELGRSGHALRHGTQALALAEEAGEEDSIKHALFLLGEAAQETGDPEMARELFERLQERYFPGASYLPDVLLTVDVRNLINLKA